MDRKLWVIERLRRGTAVGVLRSGDAAQARQLLLSVVKDGTIVLILPRPKEKTVETGR